jgi:hypothetical protein
MFLRLAGGALLAASIVVASGEGTALAQDPKPAEAPPAAAAAAAPPAAVAPVPAPQAHGVIVVATGEGSGPAARALALETYRDPVLRPAIDEATARVLAGDPVGEGAPPRLKEIAELRGAIAHADSELVARRLLASLGSELGSPLVVSVFIDAGRPVARALRSAGAVVERVELGATIETTPDGAKTFRWPGAASTLRGLLGVPDAPVAEPLRPLAPKAPAAPVVPEARPFWKSPWFWGTAGVVAAAGVTVLVLSKTQGGPGDVHLTGKVGP